MNKQKELQEAIIKVVPEQPSHICDCCGEGKRLLTLEDTIKAIIETSAKVFKKKQDLVVGTEEVEWLMGHWNLGKPLQLQSKETIDEWFDFNLQVKNFKDE